MSDPDDHVTRADELVDHLRRQEEHKLEHLAAGVPPARRPLLARTVPLWLLLAALGVAVVLGALLVAVTANSRHTATNSHRLDELTGQLNAEQQLAGTLQAAVDELGADNARLAARNGQLVQALADAGVPVPAPSGAAAPERAPARSSSSSRAQPSPRPQRSPSSSPRPRPSSSPTPSPSCRVYDPLTGRCVVQNPAGATDQEAPR